MIKMFPIDVNGCGFKWVDPNTKKEYNTKQELETALGMSIYDDDSTYKKPTVCSSEAGTSVFESGKQPDKAGQKGNPSKQSKNFDKQFKAFMSNVRKGQAASIICDENHKEQCMGEFNGYSDKKGSMAIIKDGCKEGQVKLVFKPNPKGGKCEEEKPVAKKPAETHAEGEEWADGAIARNGQSDYEQICHQNELSKKKFNEESEGIASLPNPHNGAVDTNNGYIDAGDQTVKGKKVSKTKGKGVQKTPDLKPGEQVKAPEYKKPDEVKKDDSKVVCDADYLAEWFREQHHLNSGAEFNRGLEALLALHDENPAEFNRALDHVRQKLGHDEKYMDGETHSMHWLLKDITLMEDLPGQREAYKNLIKVYQTALEDKGLGSLAEDKTWNLESMDNEGLHKCATQLNDMLAKHSSEADLQKTQNDKWRKDDEKYSNLAAKTPDDAAKSFAEALKISSPNRRSKAVSSMLDQAVELCHSDKPEDRAKGQEMLIKFGGADKNASLYKNISGLKVSSDKKQTYQAALTSACNSRIKDYDAVADSLQQELGAAMFSGNDKTIEENQKKLLRLASDPAKLKEANDNTIKTKFAGASKDKLDAYNNAKTPEDRQKAYDALKDEMKDKTFGEAKSPSQRAVLLHDVIKSGDMKKIQDIIEYSTPAEMNQMLQNLDHSVIYKIQNSDKLSSSQKDKIYGQLTLKCADSIRETNPGLARHLLSKMDGNNENTLKKMMQLAGDPKAQAMEGSRMLISEAEKADIIYTEGKKGEENKEQMDSFKSILKMPDGKAKTDAMSAEVEKALDNQGKMLEIMIEEGEVDASALQNFEEMKKGLVQNMKDHPENTYSYFNMTVKEFIASNDIRQVGNVQDASTRFRRMGYSGDDLNKITYQNRSSENEPDFLPNALAQVYAIGRTIEGLAGPSGKYDDINALLYTHEDSDTAVENMRKQLHEAIQNDPSMSEEDKKAAEERLDRMPWGQIIPGAVAAVGTGTLVGLASNMYLQDRLKSYFVSTAEEAIPSHSRGVSMTGYDATKKLSSISYAHILATALFPVPMGEGRRTGQKQVVFDAQRQAGKCGCEELARYYTAAMGEYGGNVTGLEVFVSTEGMERTVAKYDCSRKKEVVRANIDVMAHHWVRPESLSKEDRAKVDQLFEESKAENLTYKELQDKMKQIRAIVKKGEYVSDHSSTLATKFNTDKARHDNHRRSDLLHLEDAFKYTSSTSTVEYETRVKQSQVDALKANIATATKYYNDLNQAKTTYVESNMKASKAKRNLKEFNEQCKKYDAEMDACQKKIEEFNKQLAELEKGGNS
ncbi:hypothetical protein IJG72_06150 [bacterium]|nr:hypothetical protein [bacterium]